MVVRMLPASEGVIVTKLSVFVDESGDVNLPNGKPGRSRFYILTAVVLNTEEVESTRAAAEAMRSSFKVSEMHSAEIRTDKRRLAILDKIVRLNIKSYAFVVDKDELNKNSGLSFKNSFYKYINRKFYEKLVQNWGEVEICADEYGTTNFMNRFRDYLAREDKLKLFSPRFKQRSSAEEVLLQVSDIIGGSISKCVDPSKQTQSRARYVELLSKVSIGISCWPVRLAPSIRSSAAILGSSQHDTAIQDYCFQQARDFLNKDYCEDDNGTIKAETVDYMLYVAEWVDGSRWIQTEELIHHLHKLGYDVNAEKIRRTVIGPLRDNDLIIASSNRGYKIPVCLSDVKNFVNHANTIVPPMLGRLKRARDALRVLTLGQLDILADTELEYLRKVLEVGSPLESPVPENSRAECTPSISQPVT